MKFNQQFVRRRSARKALVLTLSVAALLVLAGQANATIIGKIINVSLTSANIGGDPITLNGTSWVQDPTVAPLEYAGNVWSDVIADGGVANGAANNLPYSDGTPSPVGFSLSTINAANNFAGPLTLLKKGCYSQFTTTLEITGLTSGGTYNLYLASEANGIYATQFNIIGSGQRTATGTGGSSWGENVNYVHFDGLKPDNNGDITVTFELVSGSFAVLNGFQIQEIPEPSSLALLGLGGLWLWRRRRQR